MGNVLLVNSNPVALEVQKTYSLTLVQNQNQYGVVGGAVNLPHVLTNTGNTADRYTLGLVQSSTDNFDLSNVRSMQTAIKMVYQIIPKTYWWDQLSSMRVNL